MKKIIILPFSLLIFLSFVGTSNSLPEFTKVQKPTTEQIRTINGLYFEISQVQGDIERYYKDLKEKGLVKENSTVYPLTEVVQSYYGEKKKFVLSEIGIIKWQGDKLDSFTFEQRRSKIGTGYIVKKRLSATSLASHSENELGSENAQALDFYVNEILSSGKGLTINFRFPTNPDVRDREEEIEINGQKRKVLVVYVRNQNQKIGMIREYFRLLKLLLRRIDWNVRVENQRKAAQIQRLMTIE